VPARIQTRHPSPAAVSPPAAGGARSFEKVYVARRILKIGKARIMPGQVVPGAEKWPRLESWVRAGAVEEVFRERADAG
jgi:hypothetical protein